MPGEQIVTLRLPAAGASTLGGALADFGARLTADVRVVIVTGSDLERFSAPSLDDRAVGESAPGECALGNSALGWLRRRDLVTLAVLQGEVTGVGLHVALACDLRLAADEAVISLALDADFSPQALGDITVRLADLVGYPKALELLIARRHVSGRDAARLGLVNTAVPARQLEATVDDLVVGLVSTPRERATEIKALLASCQDDRHATLAEVVDALSLARGEA